MSVPLSYEVKGDTTDTLVVFKVSARGPHSATTKGQIVIAGWGAAKAPACEDDGEQRYTLGSNTIKTGCSVLPVRCG